MIKIPELLSPAGGFEQLIAAVENGADAVYLGGKSFNARQNAGNFDVEQMKEALSYAHVRGVNVYITLNTIVSDIEMETALKYANSLYEAGADAFILQDLGLASQIAKQLPDMPLHLSTQGTIYNLEGVKIAEQMGMKRVILARELSIQEMEAIAKETNVELEVFVHGALCQSYSGQCYLSAMIGGRSGNRGNCAQPCRLAYAITTQNGSIRKTVREKGNYLSPKDLCTIEHLDKLIKTGVKSFKIEGRMKSPEYVAIVTGIYRKYLDEYAESHIQPAVSPQDIKELKQVYNRGDFSTGYLLSRLGRELITRDRAKHWGTYLGKVKSTNAHKRYVEIILEDELSMGDGIEIVNEDLPGNMVTMMQKNGQKTDFGAAGDTITVGYIDGHANRGDLVYKITEKALNRRAKETFSGKNFRKVPIIGELTALEGSPLQFSARDRDGNSVTIKSDYMPEPALTKPLLKEAAMAQISKTGSTPFTIAEAAFEIGENLSVPLSEINALRRSALDELAELRKHRYPYRKASPIEMEDAKTKRTKDLATSVYCYLWRPEMDLENLRADRIYIPYDQLLKSHSAEAVKRLQDNRISVFAAIPAVTKGEEDRKLPDQIKKCREIGIDGFLIGNLGHLKVLEQCELPIFGDHSLNIYNSLSVKAAAALGFSGVALSHEMTVSEICSMKSFGIEMEATVYGRIPVMISEHCPIGSEVSDARDSLHCGLCEQRNYCLQDRTGAEFPIIGDSKSCRSTLLSCNNIQRPELAQKCQTSEVSTVRAYMHHETPDEVNKILSSFKNSIKSL